MSLDRNLKVGCIFMYDFFQFRSSITTIYNQQRVSVADSKNAVVWGNTRSSHFRDLFFGVLHLPKFGDRVFMATVTGSPEFVIETETQCSNNPANVLCLTYPV